MIEQNLSSYHDITYTGGWDIFQTRKDHVTPASVLPHLGTAEHMFEMDNSSMELLNPLLDISRMYPFFFPFQTPVEMDFGLFTATRYEKMEGVDQIPWDNLTFHGVDTKSGGMLGFIGPVVNSMSHRLMGNKEFPEAEKEAFLRYYIDSLLTKPPLQTVDAWQLRLALPEKVTRGKTNELLRHVGKTTIDTQFHAVSYEHFNLNQGLGFILKDGALCLGTSDGTRTIDGIETVAHALSICPFVKVLLDMINVFPELAPLVTATEETGYTQDSIEKLLAQLVIQMEEFKKEYSDYEARPGSVVDNLKQGKLVFVKAERFQNIWHNPLLKNLQKSLLSGDIDQFIGLLPQDKSITPTDVLLSLYGGSAHFVVPELKPGNGGHTVYVYTKAKNILNFTPTNADPYLLHMEGLIAQKWDEEFLENLPKKDPALPPEDPVQIARAIRAVLQGRLEPTI